MSNEDGRGSGETPRTGSFYERLGVNSDASQEEIATRFRELAKQYHPDGGGGDEEKFKALSEAYATLKNATKRARYDRTFPNPNLASRPRSYSQASRAREGGRQTAPPEKGDSNTEAEAVRRREERASRARQRAEEQRQREQAAAEKLRREQEESAARARQAEEQRQKDQAAAEEIRRKLKEASESQIDWSEVSAPLELDEADLKERARAESYEQVEFAEALKQQESREKETNKENKTESGSENKTEKTEGNAEKPLGEEGGKKADKPEKKKWKDMSGAEKFFKASAMTGLTVGGVYLGASAGLWVLGAGASELGLTAPVAKGLAIGAGMGGGLGGLVVYDLVAYLGWNLIKEAWKQGPEYWAGEFFSVFGVKRTAGGGGGRAPKKAAAGGGGGGGGHAAGGGGHH